MQRQQRHAAPSYRKYVKIHVQSVIMEEEEEALVSMPPARCLRDGGGAPRGQRRASSKSTCPALAAIRLPCARALDTKGLPL